MPSSKQIEAAPLTAPSFAQRAQLTEWMDEPAAYEQLRDCLRDLERVNRAVLAYRPTLRWLAQFASAASTPLHILDVGCGGGDVLRRIEAWAKKRKLPVRLTGIDLNPSATRAARELTTPESHIEWVSSDAFVYKPSQRIDIILSSLFTHHLEDVEIARFLGWMEETAERGWFINDLSRGRVSYLGFKLLARIMRWHPFVQHDGPVSILRSFTEADWRSYIDRAGLSGLPIEVYPVRPGRLCVSRVKL